MLELLRPEEVLQVRSHFTHPVLGGVEHFHQRRFKGAKRLLHGAGGGGLKLRRNLSHEALGVRHVSAQLVPLLSGLGEDLNHWLGTTFTEDFLQNLGLGTLVVGLQRSLQIKQNVGDVAQVALRILGLQAEQLERLRRLIRGRVQFLDHVTERGTRRGARDVQPRKGCQRRGSILKAYVVLLTDDRSVLHRLGNRADRGLGNRSGLGDHIANFLDLELGLAESGSDTDRRFRCGVDAHLTHRCKVQDLRDSDELFTGIQAGLCQDAETLGDLDRPIQAVLAEVHGGSRELLHGSSGLPAQGLDEGELVLELRALLEGATEGRAQGRAGQQRDQ